MATTKVTLQVSEAELSMLWAGVNTLRTATATSGDYTLLNDDYQAETLDRYDTLLTKLALAQPTRTEECTDSPARTTYTFGPYARSVLISMLKRRLLELNRPKALSHALADEVTWIESFLGALEF